MFVNKNIVLTILFILFGLGNLHAQTDRMMFRNITFEKGLPFNKTCNVLLQDHKGFIWMGSDVGLHRFDGNDYRNFIHNPADKNSIRKGKVNAIFQDKSNNLWIGTATGIDLFDSSLSDFIHLSLFADSTFTSLNEAVRGFIENSNGDLYCYTHYFIYKYQSDKKCFIRVNTGIEVIDKGNFIHESLLFIKGYFLSGANAKGIFVFSLDEKKIWHIDVKFLGSNKVLNVFQSSSGQIWISTDKGIAVSGSINDLISNPNKNLVNINEARGLLVNRIVEDKDGGIWASTDGDGIYKINPKTLSVFKIKQNDDFEGSILNNKTALIYVDNQNNLWAFFNSYGFSVSNLKQNSIFQTFISSNRKGNCLSGNIVTALAQVKSGKIWIGTDGDGLNCFDQAKDTFTHYFSNPAIKNRLSSDVILCLYVDSDNQLWIGTYQGGLCKYEQSTDRFKTFNNVDSNENSISGNDISAITEDRKGNLYVLTITDGLNILNKFTGQFQRINSDINDKYKLSHNGGTSLLTDSKGDIWVGTYYGLNRINSNTRIITKYYNNENDTLTISDNQIDCIFEDSKKISG